MVSKPKLYHFWLKFWCLAPFLLWGFTWVKLCAWTQNHPKKVGTCPGLPLRPVSHNESFQNYRPEPPPLILINIFHIFQLKVVSWTILKTFGNYSTTTKYLIIVKFVIRNKIILAKFDFVGVNYPVWSLLHANSIDLDLL